MSSSDRSSAQEHRQLERRFIEHVERLLGDDRLRIDTTKGRRPVSSMHRNVSRSDDAVGLKRLMSDVGRPDRELETQMPVGETVQVELWQRRMLLFRRLVGRLRVRCVSPTRALLGAGTVEPLGKAAVQQLISGEPAGVPGTIVIFSTGGYTREAHELAERDADRTVLLVEPNGAGGFSVYGPAETGSLAELFDPEAEDAKRQRVRAALEQGRSELSGSGIASDRLAVRTMLPIQVVEQELRAYARANPGLSAKRLDGRIVLFREGSTPAGSASRAGGVADMPLIDRLKSLFAMRGEYEKKIAFLSERRAELGQKRDRAYEEIESLEKRDADYREQFGNASSELARRRITSQLLQLRKDLERRQQLMGVLNQQINVVSTHLHNLELVQQGQTAKLPDSEEMANDAAAAEEMLATLQESSEMAETVGGVASSGLSAEEQALYEELQRESAVPPAAALERPATATPRPQGEVSSARTPARPEPRRTEPEAG
jgi:hypothetical protein